MKNMKTAQIKRMCKSKNGSSSSHLLCLMTFRDIVAIRSRPRMSWRESEKFSSKIFTPRAHWPTYLNLCPTTTITDRRRPDKNRMQEYTASTNEKVATASSIRKTAGPALSNQVMHARQTMCRYRTRIRLRYSSRGKSS